MKLFIVDYMDDCERDYKIVIATDEEDALTKLTEEDYNCLMFATAYEISDVDGYKITLEKHNKICFLTKFARNIPFIQCIK